MDDCRETRDDRWIGYFRCHGCARERWRRGALLSETPRHCADRRKRKLRLFIAVAGRQLHHPHLPSQLCLNGYLWMERDQFRRPLAHNGRSFFGFRHYRRGNRRRCHQCHGLSDHRRRGARYSRQRPRGPDGNRWQLSIHQCGLGRGLAGGREPLGRWQHGTSQPDPRRRR